jgi:hypothetical protein
LIDVTIELSFSCALSGICITFIGETYDHLHWLLWRVRWCTRHHSKVHSKPQGPWTTVRSSSSYSSTSSSLTTHFTTTGPGPDWYSLSSCRAQSFFLLTTTIWKHKHSDRCHTRKRVTLRNIPKSCLLFLCAPELSLEIFEG